MEVLEKALNMPIGNFYLPDGVVKCDAYSQHSPYDRFLMVVEGEKHEPMSLNGKLETVILRPGDAYLIRKYIWEYVSFSHSHRFLCIIPRGNYLRLVDYKIKAGQPHNPWPQTEFFHTGHAPGAALTGVFAALSDPDAAGGGHIPHLVKAAISLALDECRKYVAKSPNKSTATFEQISSYIERHFSGDIDREFIARKFNLNPSYLSQLFKEKSGRTFQEYLLECRIGMAKMLLSTTTLQMKEIAGRCGFSGEVYFVRRFREATGITPGRYRLS